MYFPDSSAPSFYHHAPPGRMQIDASTSFLGPSTRAPVRYCPTTQKKSCLDTKRCHAQKRWWDKHGFAAACQETPTLKSTKWIYTVKCESSVSKCARREILRGASVSSCQTMWSLKWDDYEEIVLTEYFLVVSVVFFVTWIHLVVYVRFNSFQNLIIQAPKPSQSPPTNYVWCKTSKPPCNSATFGNMQILEPVLWHTAPGKTTGNLIDLWKRYSSKLLADLGKQKLGAL